MDQRPLSILLLLCLIIQMRAQFFDFFQGLQPFQIYSTLKPTQKHNTNEHTTRPTISFSSNSRNNDGQTNRSDTTNKYGSDDRDKQNKEKNTRRKQTNNSNISFYTTTVKSVRNNNNNSSRRNYDSTNNSRGNSQRTSEYNGGYYEQDRRDRNYDEGANNNIGDFYKPDNYDGIYNTYSNGLQQDNGYRNDNYNRYTTNNPFVNRPGVRPTVAHNRPPITNKPVTKPTTQSPKYVVFPRPTDSGAIAFPEEPDVSPEMTTGIDEDSMSAAEKRKYIEIAERMCDSYKSLNTKQVQAIPLLPSPDVVKVNVSACTPTTIPLVVGGKVVSIKEFPHMALLGWKKLRGGGYSWKCGGSLVSNLFVLTAAHCAYQDRDNTVVVGAPRAVQLGSSYLDDLGALVVKVSSVIRHPKYKVPTSYYDIALIKLATPVKFSEVIEPACLGVPPGVGQHVIATGWGRTEFGGEQSLELRSVSLPIWGMRECWDVLGTSRKLPDGPSSDSQVCAGEKAGGKDTCQGDSGGPVQIQDGCVWRVVAVTSLGRSCGAIHTPGLYAIVQRAFVAANVFGGQNINIGSRNDNTGSRNINTGSRNDYIGSRNNNTGSSNFNTGSSNFNTGSSNFNTGSRNDNIGSRNDYIGSRNGSTGSRNINTGSRNNNSGSRNINTGSRNNNSGSRNNNMGSGNNNRQRSYNYDDNREGYDNNSRDSYDRRDRTTSNQFNYFGSLYNNGQYYI